MKNLINEKLLIPSLEKLGVSIMAIQVYKLLLQSEQKVLSKLAKDLAISRPYLYKLLAELESHQLLQFTKSVGGNARIQLSPPTTILQLIRAQKSSVEQAENSFLQVLPQLMSEYNQGTQASKVRFFSGTEECFNLLMSIGEEEPRSMIYFGSIEDFIECISWPNQNKWVKARIAAGIKMAALLLESTDAYILKRHDKKELRETRILQTNSAFVTSYHVFSNKTVFWQPKAKLAIVIEDQPIAQMMKAMFYMLWEQN